MSRAAGRGFCRAGAARGNDILDRGLAVAQARGTQADLRALCGAIGDLPVEQEPEPSGVGKIFGGILLLELEEGIGHAVKLESSELVKGGMSKHHMVSFSGSSRCRGCCCE